MRGCFRKGAFVLAFAVMATIGVVLVNVKPEHTVPLAPAQNQPLADTAQIEFQQGPVAERAAQNAVQSLPLSTESPTWAQRIHPFSVLKGTRPPGEWEVDADGRLVLSAAVSRNFDYFLQVLGTPEADLTALDALVKGYLSQTLQEPARSEAWALYGRYQRFFLELNGRLQDDDWSEARAEFNGAYDGDTLGLVEAFQTEKEALRLRYFSTRESEALFSEIQWSERQDLIRLQLAQTDLTALQRHQLEAELAEYSGGSGANQDEGRILQHYKQLRQSEGFLAQEALSYRDLAQTYGHEKATVLIEQSRRQLAWSEKRARYEGEKGRILASLNRPEDAAQQLDRLMRDQLGFSELEIRRTQALEGRLSTSATGVSSKYRL